jgi:signal transduction histidine kinase
MLSWRHIVRTQGSRRTPGVAGGFPCAALAVCLLFAAFASQAQSPVRQVLVLQSLNRGNLTIDSLTGNFCVELDQRAGRPVNFVQILVGPTGFVSAPEQAIVDYIRSTYANHPKPDLIVAVAGPASVFARKYRQELFPDTPLLLAGADQRYLGGAPLDEHEAAVTVTNDFPRLVDEILQLRPRTRQVFMVMGSGQIGRFWRHELEGEFKRFDKRLAFIWSNDLSLSEVLSRCANLPDDSAIIYLNFSADAQGGAYADERVLADLHATANAPLFAAHSSYFGRGIVGGTLLSIDDVSRRSADAAFQILNGAPPASVTVPPAPPGKPVFDWRELQRWGIPESRLVPGSLVRYRNPSLWQEYKSIVLIGTGALVVQSLLIIGLLYQRRARRRAELESRKNLALAADANRRQTMAALTSTIAHELGQPLGSIMCNTQALQRMIAADQATPDVVDEILSDIQGQGVRAGQIIDRHRTMLRSRQLEKKPIDLHSVVAESLALVGHDLRARRIEATVQLPPGPCVISGDPVLLQQVLVNLVINAMDAMAETPPARRRLIIGAEVRTADVVVSVRDTGSGLPTNMNGKLFTPFVTTKAHGLGVGLTIARTIVKAHGGTIEGHNNPAGGATFTVTLRRSETPKARSGPPSAVQHPVPTH